MANDNKNIEIRSEEVQDILTAIPTWMIRWGSTMVLVVILLLMVITWWVKYPDIIQTEAMLTTPFPPQKEYAKTSGKIDTLLVSNDQSISANTPMAIIENSANFEDVYYLKNILDSIRPNRSDFLFPIDELPFLFLGEVETDYAFFEKSYELYALNLKLNPHSLQTSANRKTIKELRARLKNLEAQQVIVTAELALKKKELGLVKALVENGSKSEQDYDDLQLENLQAQRSFENDKLAISQIKERINQVNLSSSNTRINRTREEKTLMRQVIQSYNQLQKSIKDWELKYVLKSSTRGKVSLLDIYTDKQTVNAGDLVFTIIPQDNQEYIARLRTPALNTGKIKIGQTVNIHLHNYPEYEYGSLKGTVKTISAMTDAEGLYLIEASVSTELVTSANKQIEFKQEMRGSADIVTEDLRLIQRIFYQFRDLFGR